MAREFIFRGKSEEELKQMDLAEFAELVSTRERRTIKRGFTEAQKKLLKLVEADDKNIKTHCRNMIVIPSMLGKIIKIHNGKEFVPITIMPEMLGHRLGEFSHTRKAVSHGSAGVGATRSSKAISAR